MHEGERYLTRESHRKRLCAEERTDHHRHRIVCERADNPEPDEIQPGRFSMLEIQMRGNTKRPIAESCDPGPASPPARDRIEKHNTQEAKEERANDTIPL